MQDKNSTHITISKTWVRRLATLAAVLALAVPTVAWAGHQFSDVPDSNIFHGDIEWMADNGVTKGCNPPANTEYCPSDFVTREQMAAFMHRLETEGVFLPADGKAADADKLDGKDSTAFLGVNAKAADADKLDGLDSTAYRTRFAAISHNLGELSVIAEHGLTSAVKNGTGDYTLTWDSSVANCGWTVGNGARNGAIQTLMRRIGLNGGGGVANNVINVRVEDENDNLSDSSFSVAINC